jgi:23S rRNA (cytosine1962-C5)-methyltransferase
VENTPLRLICFEDDHLLVVNKPPGINTHAPSPHAGEGIYDWLRNREPRWACLAIIHRLDKETSGLIVFTKTPQANRSLTEQFETRAVKKTYVFLTAGRVSKEEFTVKSTLVRAGQKYVSRPAHAGAPDAETQFRVLKSRAGQTLMEAKPLTGRTHQIRVHAFDAGIPILGDLLYGDQQVSAPRLCLHAHKLTFVHPAMNETVLFEAPFDFESDARTERRCAIIDGEATNAYRVIHGASDRWPGWYVDRLGEFALSQSEAEPTTEQLRILKGLSARGVYHKVLTRHVRKTQTGDASPKLVLGEVAPERFSILENDVRYELSFAEGYSVGVFLDQRDNRRRLLTNYVGPRFTIFEGGLRDREILNTFAYTCAFSVCAAKAGARVTSLDLSRKYLDWGRRNFELNGLDHAQHDFIYGDAFDWMRRLHKKGRRFDLILLDPPTFSQSKEHGIFKAPKDYGDLVKWALPLLNSGGVLFASTNAADWPAEDFLTSVGSAITASHRQIVQEHYIPQPPDFPVSRAEPAYLKTVWLRVS